MTIMKILLCHNYYQQPGGEDESFAAEGRLLEARGHAVVRFTRHNDAIDGMGRWEVARRTFWSRETYSELRGLIRQERPDLMHCTNTFPLISPAAYDAARDEGVPVVQALRNYRLLCPNALFLRDGRACEDCLGKAVAWPGVLHGCYRESRAASAVVAGMAAAHRAMGTWARSVALYFTPSEFARQKYVEGGFPADRVAVKPNFVDPDPGPGTGRGGYAIFVGRLSPEKGVDTLLSAWSRPGAGLPPLKVVGDGPLAERVKEAARQGVAVEWLGRRSQPEVLSLIGEAACLVMPSVWYETFGRTIIEAFARGTPVIASRMGAMAELVADGRTGLHFEPGDAADLAARVRQLVSDPEALETTRRAARDKYEQSYTAEVNYRLLTGLYGRALGAGARRAAARETTLAARTV
jgi:glycosyltransferase involved in cell wall biosynthesis